jgi:hypothetical protein
MTYLTLQNVFAILDQQLTTLFLGISTTSAEGKVVDRISP